MLHEHAPEKRPDVPPPSSNRGNDSPPNVEPGEAFDLRNATVAGRDAHPAPPLAPEPEPGMHYSRASSPVGLPLPPRAPGFFWSQLGKLKNDFLGYLTESSRVADVVRLHPLPFKDIYLVSHPELVRRVLIDDAADYEKSGQTKTMVGKFLGEGLVTSEGARHKEQRSLLQPAFVPRRVASHADTILAATNEAVDRWSRAGTIELGQELKHLTLDIVARAFFGARSIDDAEGVGGAMKVFERAISGRFRSIPWPEWMPTKSNREQRAAIREMDRAVYDLLDARLAGGPHSGRSPNALDLLADAHRAGRMDRTAVRDQLVTLFFAGHETIANLMLWGIYESARNPRVAQRLADEARGANPSGVLGPADLAKLTYTEQVLKETLRLYPSAWVFDRSPKRDVELGGYRIPKGVTVFLSPFVVQRDGRWFERPLEWDPERFAPDLQGRTIEDRTPKLSYFPFGAGPRFCIGYAMAMAEGKAILGSVFSRLHLIPLDFFSPEPDPSATLGMKQPLRMGVRSRTD